MKSFALIVLFGFIGLIAVTNAIDYCDKSLCAYAEHIGCKNKAQFHERCSPDRELVEISAELKYAIVQQHNRLRHSLAMGNETGLKPCSKMASMEWNNELAYLAELNVKTCKFDHDNCHNTFEFPQSGQNLAISGLSEKFTVPASEIITPLIDAWWSEKKYATMDEINSYPMYPEKVIGHFTVMAVEGNNRVGCAASKYLSEDKKWHLFQFACNYAKTNIIDRKIYSSGKTASKCETGTNSNFNGLCSLKEQYPYKTY